MGAAGEGLGRLEGGGSGGSIHANKATDKQSVCFRQTLREGATQRGSLFLSCSWRRTYRDRRRRLPSVHKGLEAKCERSHIDFKCIWEVILHFICGVQMEAEL